MAALTTFLKSPFARHPGLMLRKVAERLGLYRHDAPIPHPTSSEIVLPPYVRQRLEQWIATVSIVPRRHSFSALYGHAFEEAELLRLCASGPVKGRKDLTADIKLIWDFSRAHPLFLNLCVDRNDIESGADFVHRWLGANENLNGPAWTCAMDVAIRAINWLAADAISGGALGRKLGRQEWGQWLWRHGAVVWQRLESRINPSNHYLADLIGLIAVGAVFPEDASARRWRNFGEKEFPRALLAQSHPDGGLNEASLRYHAFVTEMALIAQLFASAPFPAEAQERIKRMCQLVADFRDTDGNVFPLGDDDSGRVLALDHASTAGWADVLLKLAESQFGNGFSTRSQATCPDSGWWIQRRADWTVAVEFGGVGSRGHGGHAHSDDLSVCIEWGTLPLVVDPGTYAYTWNPEARNRLRSATAHNSVIIDGQDPLPPGRELFFLPGRDRPWSCDIGESSAAFERTTPGGIHHRRTIQFDKSRSLMIEDVLSGVGSHEVVWRFHLHPQWKLEVRGRSFVANGPGNSRLLIDISSQENTLTVEAGEYSSGYGQIETCAVAVAAAVTNLPFQCRFTFRADTGNG